MNRGFRLASRFAAIAAAVGGLAATASGYYHFVHYTSQTAPYTLVPEKFDLAALRNKTLYYYVSDLGPAAMAGGDSYAALLSQIRMAGQIWDGVSTSDLRVAYGGLFSPGTAQSTPHMEVLFDDTPGVIAMGGPTSRADATTGPDGPFVPITGSVVILNRDLTGRPSYDALSLTIVHEMGHALGLQHTLTSSMMSTEVTRASTQAKPLGADDVAAISLLYPSEQFASRFGSLSGRVSISGHGVHLASVVALTFRGHAVSALTAPDGTYKIDGVPPGQYYVYAHALPPSVQSDLGPSDIVLPRDPDGQPVPAGDSFRTRFYPDTTSLEQAQTVAVDAGATTSGIDFSVERRGAPQIYSITTWSFPGQKAVKPAYVNSGIPARSFLVATGPGLMPDGAPAPGVNVSVLGDVAGVAPDGVYAYSLSPRDYLQVNFRFTPFSTQGARHLVFSAGDEIYVLPSGLNVVNSRPPSITSVAPDVDGSGVAAVVGTGFTAGTRILFNGLEAQVLNFDEAGGRIVVRPPAGPSGFESNVIALNADGQTSLFTGDASTYTYDGPSEGTSSVVLSASSLPAGAESMIEVEGINTRFTPDTRLGFGSGDITVKRLWVLSPTRLRANVAVAPSAPATSTVVCVTTGFHVISQPFAFQIEPPNGHGVMVSSDLVNPALGTSWVYPGSLAAVSASNVAADSNVHVTLNDIAVSVAETAENRITFQVPADFGPGPATLRVQAGSETSFPVVVTIGLPPPVVTAVMFGNSGAVDASQPVHPGDLLTVQVAGLDDPTATIAGARVRVKVGGIDHPPAGDVQPAPHQPGKHQISFVLSKDIASGQQPVVVTIDDRASPPYVITVAAGS